VTSIFGWAGDFYGCAWYRVALPLDELARRGHTTAHAKVAAGDDLAAMQAADVLVGQRVSDRTATLRWQCLALARNPRYQRWIQEQAMALPWLFEVWQAALRREPQRLVYEVDDDLLHVHPSNGKAHAYFADPGVRRNIAQNLRLADRVVVTNEHLADVVREHNAEVRVVPNTVPAWLTEHDPQRREDVVTVGWAGSATHAIDWGVMDDELVRYLSKTRSRAELHVIGGLGERWSRVPLHRRRITPWLDSIPDYYRAIDFHIGLAPLADIPFNWSKSYIKALEYAALGIPVIASDVGPYREFVRHGETGYLVRKPRDWVRYLRELTYDAAARAEMGAAARRLAQQHTVEKQGHLWEEALCRP
jgi:glycosyltransferase involved in cell wall biosynthesis